MNKIDPLVKEYFRDFKKEANHLLGVIKKYDRIAIFRHVTPDFDALGSQLGLATWINDNFPKKEVKCLGDNHVNFTPHLYREMDSLNESWFNEPFLAIIVDCPTKSRIADPRWKKAKYKVKIDHHPLMENFGKIQLVNEKAAAASEFIVGLLVNLKGDYVMSKEAASHFYTGLVGDSGRFVYNCTTRYTFAIAGELLKSGIDISEIYHKMYERDINELYVSSYILNNFKLTDNGVAYYVLSDETQKQLNMVVQQGKDNINLFSNIKGINVWVSFTEDVADHCWRVSIRSKQIAINEVATHFRGGGHANASGARIKNLSELPLLIEELDNLCK